jgi:hypothetical protein
LKKEKPWRLGESYKSPYEGIVISQRRKGRKEKEFEKRDNLASSRDELGIVWKS